MHVCMLLSSRSGCPIFVCCRSHMPTGAQFEHAAFEYVCACSWHGIVCTLQQQKNCWYKYMALGINVGDLRIPFMPWRMVMEIQPIKAFNRIRNFPSVDVGFFFFRFLQILIYKFLKQLSSCMLCGCFHYYDFSVNGPSHFNSLIHLVMKIIIL